MSELSKLSGLVEGALEHGASNAVERLFGGDGWLDWHAAVRAAAIDECGEPLTEIPEMFPRMLPHAYGAVGAPYGSASPFFLRRGIVERLLTAQSVLGSERPGCRLSIFDGYRPLGVQRFLARHFFESLIEERKLDASRLTEQEMESLYDEVYQILARPNDNPKTPTPHSTGAAVDLTVVDESGRPLAMGSPIDAMPPECLPSFFTDRSGEEAAAITANRLLLERSMRAAGFRRLPQEWWHFSCGDQVWAVLESLESRKPAAAFYGRADLVL